MSSTLAISELMFFDTKSEALPLYEILRAQILKTCPGTTIRVKKTQISFYNRHLFAAVSFLPARKRGRQTKANPLPPYITLTFGLSHCLTSPRVDAAVCPYPERWTHHIMIEREEQIDDELIAWVQEAARLAEGK